jgi:hypothetical protein
MPALLRNSVAKLNRLTRLHSRNLGFAPSGSRNGVAEMSPSTVPLNAHARPRTAGRPETEGHEDKAPDWPCAAETPQTENATWLGPPSSVHCQQARHGTQAAQARRQSTRRLLADPSPQESDRGESGGDTAPDYREPAPGNSRLGWPWSVPRNIEDAITL